MIILNGEKATTCTGTTYYYVCCNRCGAPHPTETFDFSVGTHTWGKHNYLTTNSSNEYLKSLATCQYKKDVFYMQCTQCKANAVKVGATDQTFTVDREVGHDWGPSETISVQSCTTEGKTARKCKTEGCTEILPGQTWPALDHAWGDVQRTDGLSCEVGGEEYKMCTRDGCGEKQTIATYPDGLGHEYGKNSTATAYLVQNLTCCDAKSYYYKCSRCNAKDTNQTWVPNQDDKIAHVWIILSAGYNTFTFKCDLCGMTQKDKTSWPDKYYVCSHKTDCNGKCTRCDLYP